MPGALEDEIWNMEGRILVGEGPSNAAYLNQILQAHTFW